jgi:hypothetical protein
MLALIWKGELGSPFCEAKSTSQDLEHRWYLWRHAAAESLRCQEHIEFASRKSRDKLFDRDISTSAQQEYAIICADPNLNERDPLMLSV